MQGIKPVVVAAVCALLAPGCTGAGDHRPPATTSRPGSTVTPSRIPVPHGAKIAHPHSSPAEVGVPYPYELYTHCGLDFHVDFDGSFWQLVEGSAHGPFRNPLDQGAMTLLPSGLAEFRSRSGSSVQFVRYPFPKEFQLCD